MSSVAMSLAAKAVELSQTKATGKVTFVSDDDGKSLVFSATHDECLMSTGDSSTGQTKGFMANLNGTFDKEIDGKIYTFQVNSPRGAWLTVKCSAVRDVPTKSGK